jgi:hypothetical protein
MALSFPPEFQEKMERTLGLIQKIIETSGEPNLYSAKLLAERAAQVTGWLADCANRGTVHNTEAVGQLLDSMAAEAHQALSSDTLFMERLVQDVAALRAQIAKAAFEKTLDWDQIQVLESALAEVEQNADKKGEQWEVNELFWKLRAVGNYVHASNKNTKELRALSWIRSIRG